MEEVQADVATDEVTGQGVVTVAPSQELPAAPPPTSEAPCPTCGSPTMSMSASSVYAIGRIEPRFPGASVEKEFAQVVSRAETGGQTDQQTLYNVLSDPENRYLARQLCWVLTVQ